MPQPPEILRPQADDRDDALAVLRRLREAGHIAYFAGGCVRDELLGQVPKDYDIATNAPPARVRSLFTQTQAVGAAFGVILVKHRRSIIEVATFRAEDRYEDGRRPERVRFTTAEEDARRRDFTINGLFLDPLDGRVIDYVGGQKDLADRRLRAIGDPDKRFAEDHLRLLRAVRFAARFDLAIDSDTAAAIGRHARRLIRISPERIAEELRIMLCAPTRRRAWPMLWDLGLIDTICRFLPDAPEVRSVKFDAERSLFLAVARGEPIPFGVALAAGGMCYRMQLPGSAEARTLLGYESVGKMARAMRQALRISNDEARMMSAVLEPLGPLLGDSPPSVAVKKRFLALPAADWSRRLLEAMAAVGHHTDRIAALQRELCELEEEDCAPAPFVTGDDLTAAGLRPGPLFKRILDATYDAQLEHRVTERHAALQFALQLAGEYRADQSAGD